MTKVVRQGVRDSSADGAAVGALAGFGIGVGLLAIAYANACDTCDPPAFWALGGPAGAVGAGGGALVGYLSIETRGNPGALSRSLRGTIAGKSREHLSPGAHPIERGLIRSMPAPSPTSPLAALDDAELAGRIVHRDEAAFEALMRRHNGRLFRVARAILKDDSEAEDALQDAYLDAYRHIADFRGSAQVGTWLTRIVVNQALMRLRRQKSRIVLSFEDWQGEMRAAGRADGRGEADRCRDG